MLAIVWMSWVSGVQAASDVVSEVERAVEQYSKGVGHLTQKLPLPGDTPGCAPSLRYGHACWMLWEGAILCQCCWLFKDMF